MWSPLNRGTSEIDWCEENYLFSPLIAEFVNTISSVAFLIFPPLLFVLFKPYAKSFNPGIQFIWLLLFIIGLSSVYFHATLSLLGQLLDELAILWSLMAGFALWFPDKLLPQLLQEKRQKFQMLICCLTVLISIMTCIKPAVNSFALMCFGLPVFLLLLKELKRCRSKRVRQLGKRCSVIWFLSISCWLSDRLFCDIWTYVHFPYLHGIWHIFIFIASYTVCVLFAYFDAIHLASDLNPVMTYWPLDSWEWGIPYVIFMNKIF